MIYLAIYAAIGVAVSIWVPWQRDRLLVKIDELGPEARARMSPDQRRTFDGLVESMRKPIAPGWWIAIGALWPVQIPIAIIGHRLGNRLIGE